MQRVHRAVQTAELPILCSNVFIWNLFCRSSYMGLPSQSSRSHFRESLKTEWKLPHPKVPHLHSTKAWWNVPTAVYSTQPMNIETCSSMLNTARSSRTFILKKSTLYPMSVYGHFESQITSFAHWHMRESLYFSGHLAFSLVVVPPWAASS